MDGGRDEGVILALGDVHPPKLLLVIGEVGTMDGMRHFALPLEGLFPPVKRKLSLPNSSQPKPIITYSAFSGSVPTRPRRPPRRRWTGPCSFGLRCPPRTRSSLPRYSPRHRCPAATNDQSLQHQFNLANHAKNQSPYDPICCPSTIELQCCWRFEPLKKMTCYH